MGASAADAPVDDEQYRCENENEDQHLEAGLLALLQLRLRRPGEEDGHVAGVLSEGHGRAVHVLDGLVVEGLRHGDLLALVEVVEAHAVGELHPLGRLVLVAGHQRVEVVRTALPRLDDQREVRRQRAAVQGPRLVIVGEGRRPVIGEPGGAEEHLALVVGPVLDLVFLGDRLRLLLGEVDLQQIAEGDVLERMAGGADLLEYLEAPLQLAPVEGAEDAFVLPVLIGNVRRIAGRVRGMAAEERERADHQPGQ